MNKIKPEAWMHGYMEKLTDLRGEGSEGDWKRLAKEHICIYAKPMDTDNDAVKAGAGAAACGGGKMGGICNSVNNKSK